MSNIVRRASKKVFSSLKAAEWKNFLLVMSYSIFSVMSEKNLFDVNHLALWKDLIHIGLVLDKYSFRLSEVDALEIAMKKFIKKYIKMFDNCTPYMHFIFIHLPRSVALFATHLIGFIDSLDFLVLLVTIGCFRSSVLME